MTIRQLRIMIVGAHPDDCEFRCGGVAAIWARRGHQVCFLSVTDGGAGHHQLAGAPLVRRRATEAQAAADVIGAESRIMPCPDGHLEPTLENRLALIRHIREFKADVVITNRPNDYHPDHRYTSLLVQDAAFMLTVPHVAPQTPVLQRNPFIFYFWDGFQKPLPFQADVVVGIDDVFQQKLQMLHCHESQVYEWLAWLDGQAEVVPGDEAGRKAWLRKWYDAHSGLSSDKYREKLVERYGRARGNQVREAEAFEICEYGSPISPSAIEEIFGGI